MECKLATALYGLKENPRDCFDKYVTRLELKKNNMYVLRKINIRARVRNVERKHTQVYISPP